MLSLILLEILILLTQPVMMILAMQKKIGMFNGCCLIVLTIIPKVIITYINIQKYGRKDYHYESLMNMIITSIILILYISFFDYLL